MTIESVEIGKPEDYGRSFPMRVYHKDVHGKVLRVASRIEMHGVASDTKESDKSTLMWLCTSQCQTLCENLHALGFTPKNLIAVTKPETCVESEGIAKSDDVITKSLISHLDFVMKLYDIERLKSEASTKRVMELLSQRQPLQSD